MMTDNKNRSLLAIILIFTGIIFLGESLGKYNFSFIFFMRSYWPGLLIIFGFHILLQKTKLWYIVPAAVTALCLYIIYLLFNQESIYFMPEMRMRIFHFRNFF